MVTKSKCPSCARIGRDRHADNLIIYPNGGSHCFSCGYHSHGTASRRPFTAPPAGDQPSTQVTLLPYDIDTTIPAKCLDWLRQYHITYQDIIENDICWSEQRQLLLFPYDNCWQGRYFGSDDRHPKWWSKGNLDNQIWGKLLEPRLLPNGIILVEDIISTIRVGKYFPTICLFGSSLSKTKLARLLTHMTHNLIWWLDYDKKDYANERALYLQGLGYDSRAIVTPLDPKQYSNSEIISIISQLGLDKNPKSEYNSS